MAIVLWSIQPDVIPSVARNLLLLPYPFRQKQIPRYARNDSRQMRLGLTYFFSPAVTARSSRFSGGGSGQVA